MELNDREKKILLFGGIALLAMGLYQWVLVPVLSSQELVREKLPSQEMILAKSKTKIARKEPIKIKTKAIEEEIARAEKKLLHGKTPSLAAAELQKILKKIANQSKIKVSSEKILATVVTEEYQKIPIRITLKGLVTNLKNALHKIETHSTSITISEASIKVTNTRNPSNVEAALTISGIIKTTEAERKKIQDKKSKSKKRK